MNLSDRNRAAEAGLDAGERPFVVIEACFDFICP
ncbi:hypothetical protein SAMN05446635_0737 [Burkholderia sp. OK233]|nr:hypothetical protein SAMN05446635_0737 [Burkholderia sp. OK233]